MAASDAGRWLNEKLFDIDRRRTLPVWKGETLERWIARQVRPDTCDVALFNDTFTNYYNPEIGIAALQVLERGSRRARVVRPACCGRPLISKGL